MSTKRTTHKTTERIEHTVKPGDTVVEPTEKIVEKHVETTETVHPAQPQPKNVNLNVNTDSTPGADQVSVNTPDGTQVNINP